MSQSPVTEIVPTPEQEAIYKVGWGFFLVVANAGSGKTTACAELFVRLYRREQAKLFPGRGNVEGSDQIKLLRLFLLVSFTRKAAAELDERIHVLFKKAGIPIPHEFGKPARLCSTLDAVLRQWLKLGSFFEAWSVACPALPQTFNRLFAALSPSVQAEMMNGAKVSPGAMFFRRWGGLLSGDAQLIFLDAIRSRLLKQPPIVSMDTVRSELTRFVSTAPDVASLKHLPLLPHLEETWKERVSHYRHLEHHSGRQVDPLHVVELNAWKERVDALESFLTAFDFARSRGWNPVGGYDLLKRRDILNTLAGFQAIKSVNEFAALARDYQQSKEAFGLMDFGDYLCTFVSVVEHPKGAVLLERDREYPVRGIRRKHVVFDENQDNNGPQFTVQRKLTAASNVPYLSLGVGDPFQSLYEFRGAHPLQFIRGIERLRENKPDHLLTLSVCFRSGRKIVALGNEIIKTLSRYGATSTPSRAVKPFDGEIATPLPFPDAQVEASYILDLLARRAAAGESCLVLLRARIDAHPIAKALAEAKLDRVSIMTVHAAKGLEADHVVVAGMNAGVFPDVRCSAEQEVNLFYVACTRARKSLTLTCHTTTMVVEKDGSVKQEPSSPSPFFGDTPSLRALATASGWPGHRFSDGKSAHRQAIAVQIEQKEAKLHEFRKELDRLAPNAAHPQDDEEAPAYRGARTSDFEVTINSDVRADPGTPAMPKGPLMDVCKRLFMKGGKPATLKADERLAATRYGWITFRGSGQVFSPAFIAEARKASR